MKTQDRGTQRLLAGMRRWVREREEMAALFDDGWHSPDLRAERAEQMAAKVEQLAKTDAALYSIWYRSHGKTIDLPVFQVSPTDVWSLRLDLKTNTASVAIGHLVDVREAEMAAGAGKGKR